MTSIINSIKPTEGPTYGGNLVRLDGPAPSTAAAIAFGGQPARIVHRDASGCIVRAPEHAEGAVDVTVFSGIPSKTVPQAYTYVRANLVPDSDLARLVRALLRDIKRHVMARTTITVDVAYAGVGGAENPSMALATLPALVLTGPTLRPNRLHARAQRTEAPGPGATLLAYPPPFTVDLIFSLTGSSTGLAEMLNLMHASTLYASRRGYLSLDRDPALPGAGQRRWAIVPHGDARTHFDDREGVRSFTCEFFIQAFDIEADFPIDLATPAPDIDVDLNKGANAFA